MNEINWDEAVVERDEEVIPAMFMCPLSGQVMVDPVVDRSNGVAYERRAILEERPAVQIVPNLALKELIHDYMGEEWSLQQTDNGAIENIPNNRNNRHAGNQNNQRSNRIPIDDDDDDDDGTIEQQQELLPAAQCCESQERILGFLVDLDPTASLDENGECLFLRDNMLVTVNVPRQQDLLILYVSPLTPTITAETRAKMLHLNFMQAETFGGWLSLRSGTDGDDEVMFSYAIAVSDMIDVDDFKAVVENFCSWAFRLRIDLSDNSASPEFKDSEIYEGHNNSPNQVGQL